MSQINSPYLLAKIRPLSELSEPLNNYFSQQERIIQQIYRRVGGGTDVVDINAQDVAANTSAIEQVSSQNKGLKSQIEVLEKLGNPEINAQVQSLRSQVECLEKTGTPEIDAQIKAINKKLDAIEQLLYDATSNRFILEIFNRIEAIERQL